MTLGEQARRLRVAQGVPRKRVEGVSPSWVHKIERDPPASVTMFDGYLRRNFGHRLAIVPDEPVLDLRGRLKGSK